MEHMVQDHMPKSKKARGSIEPPKIFKVTKRGEEKRKEGNGERKKKIKKKKERGGKRGRVTILRFYWS